MGSLFSASFNPDTDLLDLHGKVAIVTGGNQGIGFWTVHHLSKRGAKVYLAARSESKATGAIAHLNELDTSKTKGTIEYLYLDLDDPRQAKKSAEEFLTRETRLDIVVNNAGIMSNPYTKTKDGIVNSMVVNHLSPFVFINTLSPLLEKTASEPNSDVRIVTVSSLVHSMIKDAKFDSVDAFNATYEGFTMPDMKRYAHSKLANILWTKQLQRRYDAKNVPITCIAIHPGGVFTDTAVNSIRQKMAGPVAWLVLTLARPFSDTPEPGSYTSLFAAASKAVSKDKKAYRGSYLKPYGTIAAASSYANDPKLAETLWTTSENILKDVFEL